MKPQYFGNMFPLGIHVDTKKCSNWGRFKFLKRLSITELDYIDYGIGFYFIQVIWNYFKLVYIRAVAKKYSGGKVAVRKIPIKIFQISVK